MHKGLHSKGLGPGNIILTLTIRLLLFAAAKDGGSIALVKCDVEQE